MIFFVLFTKATAMSCRKIVESPETCVDDMLLGVATSYPQLQFLPEARSLVALSVSMSFIPHDWRTC